MREKKERIFCLGDSNTFGYDPCSFWGEPYPEEVRWTGRVNPEKYEMLNYGQNGLCIPGPGAWDAVAALIRSEKPDRLLILLGTNDLLQGASAEETARRMEAFGRAMREACPELPVLLIAPPRLNRGTWVEERARKESESLGKCYRETAARLGFDFADAGRLPLPTAFDGVHLTEEGHRMLAAYLEEKMG